MGPPWSPTCSAPTSAAFPRVKADGDVPPRDFLGCWGCFHPSACPQHPAPGRPARCSSPPQTLGGAPKPGTPQPGGGQQHPRDPSEPKGGSVNPGGGLWEEGGPLPQLLGLRRKARLEGLRGVGKGGFNNHKSSQLGGAFTATPTSNPLCYEELKLPGSVLIEGFLTALIGMR